MRIRGLKFVTVKKGGKTYRYYYHRATNKRIEAAFGTAAFIQEVTILEQRARDKAPRDGSLGALVTAYRKSPQFTGLADVSRKDYDRVFDWLKPMGDIPLVSLTSSHIYKLQDKAFRERKRRFANYVVQVMRLLLTWGKPRAFVAENVAVGVEAIKRPKSLPRANRPWDDAEREAVLENADHGLRLIIALGMFAGLREGDACALLKDAFDGSRIETVASKNGEPISIPAHFRLRKICNEANEARRERLAHRSRRRKVVPIDPPTLAVSTRGTSWTPAGFRASFFKLIGRMERDGLVRPGLTFHGLRHTMGKLVMEAGGSKEDVGIILGDRSMAMAEHYSREHEKRGRANATMDRLEQTEREKMEKRVVENGKPLASRK